MPQTTLKQKTARNRIGGTEKCAISISSGSKRGNARRVFFPSKCHCARCCSPLLVYLDRVLSGAEGGVSGGGGSGAGRRVRRGAVRQRRVGRALPKRSRTRGGISLKGSPRTRQNSDVRKPTGMEGNAAVFSGDYEIVAGKLPAARMGVDLLPGIGQDQYRTERIEVAKSVKLIGRNEFGRGRIRQDPRPKVKSLFAHEPKKRSGRRPPNLNHPQHQSRSTSIGTRTRVQDYFLRWNQRRGRTKPAETGGQPGTLHPHTPGKLPITPTTRRTFILEVVASSPNPI